MLNYVFRCSHAATRQCALVHWRLLLGRWPDEDVKIGDLEEDVYAMSQTPQRARLSDDSDESPSSCTLSVLKLTIRVERSESNRRTLTTLTYTPRLCQIQLSEKANVCGQ
jgi:hypothetical protein